MFLSRSLHIWFTHTEGKFNTLGRFSFRVVERYPLVNILCHASFSRLFFSPQRFSSLKMLLAPGPDKRFWTQQFGLVLKAILRAYVDTMNVAQRVEINNSWRATTCLEAVLIRANTSALPLKQLLEIEHDMRVIAVLPKIELFFVWYFWRRLIHCVGSWVWSASVWNKYRSL